MEGAVPHPGEPDAPPERVVRVMTVDDQPVFLRAARDLIEVTPGFAEVAEANSGRRALELVAAAQPDLALVDVRMPGLDGIETARLLHARRPEMLVVLVSSDEPDDLEGVGCSCGAAALVRKRDLGPRLLRRLWAEHRRG